MSKKALRDQWESFIDNHIEYPTIRNKMARLKFSHGRIWEGEGFGNGKEIILDKNE